jgi:hypothetical protein
VFPGNARFSSRSTRPATLLPQDQLSPEWLPRFPQPWAHKKNQEDKAGELEPEALIKEQKNGIRQLSHWTLSSRGQPALRHRAAITPPTISLEQQASMFSGRYSGCSPVHSSNAWNPFLCLEKENVPKELRRQKRGCFLQKFPLRLKRRLVELYEEHWDSEPETRKTYQQLAKRANGAAMTARKLVSASGSGEKCAQRTR